MHTAEISERCESDGEWGREVDSRAGAEEQEGG